MFHLNDNISPASINGSLGEISKQSTLGGEIKIVLKGLSQPPGGERLLPSLRHVVQVEISFCVATVTLLSS